MRIDLFRLGVDGLRGVLLGLLGSGGDGGGWLNAKFTRGNRMQPGANDNRPSARAPHLFYGDLKGDR